MRDTVRRFPAILTIVVLTMACPELVGRAVAQSPSPVVVKAVFYPDLADVRNDDHQVDRLKDAVKQLDDHKHDRDPRCYPFGVTFKIGIGRQSDRDFGATLGTARAEALRTELGIDPSLFEYDAVAGHEGEVQVNANNVDRDPPLIRAFTSIPPEGTRVEKGETIDVTITASERHEDGHASRPSGVRTIELMADGNPVEAPKTMEPPEPCARPTVKIPYTVPASPRPIIHLQALATDAVGHSNRRDISFPTKGKYFGALTFTSRQPVTAGVQYFTGAFDVLLDVDGNGNVTGTLSGIQREKLDLSVCKSDTSTPGRLTAKLTGILKKDHMISLDASDGTFTPPEMTPCQGRQPGKAPAAYTWPHFSQVFHALQRGADGVYAFDHQWDNPAAGYTFTERYTLKLEPVKEPAR